MGRGSSALITVKCGIGCLTNSTDTKLRPSISAQLADMVNSNPDINPEVANLADEVVSASRLTEIASATTRISIAQPLRLDQTEMKNELLLFIKPEVFLVDRQEYVTKTISLVFQKLAEYRVQSGGIVVMTGTAMQETEVMSRHYGLINRLSIAASQMITPDDMRKIAEAQGISEKHPVLLGGHEFLSKFPDLSADDLDRLWLSERSTKMRSGFYLRPLERDGQTFILVNGFHPKQLAHFTDPSHRIVLIVLHSDTDWNVLKNQMVGSTFPDLAEPASIRGSIYADPKAYGFDSVGIANNAVHLSAGPFEAMFELNNFFGNMGGGGPDSQKPLVLCRMLDEGIDLDLALHVLDNPSVPGEATATDLFTATEDMNTDDAIKYWQEHFVNMR